MNIDKIMKKWGCPEKNCPDFNDELRKDLEKFRQEIIQKCIKSLPEEGIEWMQEGSHHKERRGFTSGFNECRSQFLKAIKDNGV